jgi:signal transduction histidine kinase
MSDAAAAGAPTRGGWAPRFADDLVRPLVFAAIAAIATTQFLQRPPVVLAALTWACLVVAVGTGFAMTFLHRGLPERARVALAWLYAVVGVLLFALAPSTAAVAYVYDATATTGERVASRRTGIALGAAATAGCLVAAQWAEHVLAVDGEGPWWLPLTVGLPLYMGYARRERAEALAAARLAAEQGRRALASEKRAAALEERGRIAREIHDVLGHSLSGIAVQLDMADALHAGGRSEERRVGKECRRLCRSRWSP